ncbi:MAG: hypothetical protein KGO05_05215 [Chloroflexota bacterium]|nr:hypothetical protein [Chloroflexota bacterium]
MIIVGLAAIGATVVAGLLLGLAWLVGRKQWPAPRAIALWVAPIWGITFALNLVILYFDMPALTGPWGGWQWLLWPLILLGGYVVFGGSFTRARQTLDALNGRLNSIPRGFGGRGGGRGRVVNQQPDGAIPNASYAGGLAIVGALVIAFIINGLIVVGTTWFDGNAKALAAIPHIVSAPASQPLPPTNVDHIVLVTQAVASYLGQQTLAAGGQNLGSVYHTDPAEYTLQSVRGHLYWIAPLVYNNVWANLGNWQSPGYVVVDAEDPNVAPTLRTGYHMRYLPDALFNQDLLRHVYLSGYTWGDLVDPTLEVDDNWRPYFTISLMQPTRGFTGEVVKRVLVVDCQTGAIANDAPGDVPTWVDRIIPAASVDDYLNWWGKYAHAPWFNPSGQGQQIPSTSEPELVYNQVDQPVWLEPMTSSAASDNSSTGVVLFDTRDMTGRFYPLTGLGVTNNVTTIFRSNPANIRNYAVGNIQLYQIYNEPTWVATFVQTNEFGASYQAVGIVDAKHLLGSNVIMAPDKASALAAYAQYLADNNVAGVGPTPTGKTVTLTGKIARVSQTTERGAAVYYMTIAGQSRIFKAGLALSPELPLAQPGDSVTLTFLDTGQNVVTLTSFSDADIPLSGAQPTPIATP